MKASKDKLQNSASFDGFSKYSASLKEPFQMEQRPTREMMMVEYMLSALLYSSIRTHSRELLTILMIIVIYTVRWLKEWNQGQILFRIVKY